MSYLFGYGSLINHNSRRLTVVTGEAIPARLLGAKRAWNVRVPNLKMAALGLIFDEASTCNGVLVTVTEDDILAFDKREGPNYERVEIPGHSITGHKAEIDSVAPIWTYVVKVPIATSPEFPIVESYVDVVLAGCLRFGEKFVVEFIRTTTGWDGPWIDDRSNPRYIRSEQRMDLHLQIDAFLAKYAPAGFAKRQDCR